MRREGVPVARDGPVQQRDSEPLGIDEGGLRADTGDAGGTFREASAGRGSDPALRPGLAVPDEGVRPDAAGARHLAEHVGERELLRQRRDGELLRAAEGRDVPRRGVPDCRRVRPRAGKLHTLLEQREAVPRAGRNMPCAIPSPPAGGLLIFMSNFCGAYQSVGV